MSILAGQIVEPDLSHYGDLPKDVWGWYQLRLKYNDGGRYDIAPSTHDHLEVLRQYARECNHITEFGVRYVVSTWALLAGNPKRMVSVDERVCPVEPVYEATAKIGIDYEFICADDLTIDIEPTDLLFIDSLHTYEHLTAELKRHSQKVSKYIILHDTDKPEMARAAIEFAYKNNGWVFHEVRPNSFGLTILKKSPVFHRHLNLEHYMQS